MGCMLRKVEARFEYHALAFFVAVVLCQEKEVD